MTRFAFAVVVLGLASIPAFALRIAAPTGVLVKAATADVIVSGKITDIEKEPVEAAQFPGSTQKFAYRIALVKIDDAIVGTKNETHIKVGFLPTTVGIRSGQANFEMKPDAEGTFFLRKHHDGNFYTFDFTNQPIDAKAETYKADLEAVKKAVAAMADPDKALKATDAKDRYFAAAAIVTKYRTAPGGTAVRSEAVPAEQSKALVKAILEAGWSTTDKAVPPPYQTFMKLGMTAKDGWKPTPFKGDGDFNAHMKAEFQKWIDGDGAKFQIKKFVPAK